MSAETRKRKMGLPLLLAISLGTCINGGLLPRFSVEAFQYYYHHHYYSPTSSSGRARRLTLMEDSPTPFGTCAYARGVIRPIYATGSSGGGKDGEEVIEKSAFGRMKTAYDGLTGWGVNAQEPSSSFSFLSSSSSSSRSYKKKTSGAAAVAAASQGSKSAKSENSRWDLPPQRLSQSKSYSRSSSSKTPPQSKNKSAVYKSVYHSADPQKLIRLTDYLKTGPAFPKSSSSSSSSSDLFDLRTVKVAKAALRGASLDQLAREWASMNKDPGDHAASASATPAPPPPPLVSPSPPSSVAPSSLYEQRTDKVAAASAAGQSRWGEMESKRTMTAVSDQLAREWAAINRDAAVEQKQAPVTTEPPPASFISKPAVLPPPAPPAAPVARGTTSSPSMDDLAKAWGGMNKDNDRPHPTPPIPYSPPPQPQPKAAPVPASPAAAPAGATISIDDLSKVWSSMNTDQDAAPRLPSVKPPASFVKSPPMVEEPSTTSSSSSIPAAPAAMSMDDLAKAWAIQNADPDAAPRPPNVKK